MGVREDLKVLMDTKGISLTAVSRALGLSAATMSQWLAEKYPGKASEIEQAVKSFIERQKEKNDAPGLRIKFVDTFVSKKVFEVARICHLDGDIGVLFGDAGLGKTDAVVEYNRQNPDVILLVANLGYTAKVLFRKLHRKLGMDGAGNIEDMYDDVVSKLKGSGRLIIIDEAEHLPYRALELLRSVYDNAGVGILLVGMPRLVANLRGKKGEYAQLYSRVGIAYRVESLKPEDTQSIVYSVVPSSNGLWHTYHQESHGNTRVLVKLLRRAARISEINNIPIDADVIKKAAQSLII